MVGNVGWNEMNVWENFYRDVMGFANLITFDDKDISTQYTALMSKVMTNGNGRIKFPINEPAEGAKRQLQWAWQIGRLPVFVLVLAEVMVISAQHQQRLDGSHQVLGRLLWQHVAIRNSVALYISALMRHCEARKQRCRMPT